MATLRYLPLLCLLACAPCAWAQKAASAIREEHRYQFSLNSAITPYQEKVLVQQITGLEPGMRVNIDHDERLIKVLAYREIDPQEVISIAAQNSISIGNRRRLAEPAQDNAIHE